MTFIDKVELKLLFIQNDVFDSEEAINIIKNIIFDPALTEINIKGCEIFFILNELANMNYNFNNKNNKIANFLNECFNLSNTTYTEEEKNIFLEYIKIQNLYMTSFSLDYKDIIGETINALKNFILQNNSYNEKNYVWIVLQELKILLLTMYNLLLLAEYEKFDLNFISELIIDIKSH